jgi:hypothetical protein
VNHGEILAVAIGVIAIVMAWYRLHGSFVNWLLVGAGLLGADLIKQWLVPYMTWTVSGLSIVGIITIVIFIVFYAEVIRGANKHHLIAPLVSFATGAALVLTLGAATSVVMPAGHLPATTAVIQHNG